MNKAHRIIGLFVVTFAGLVINHFIIGNSEESALVGAIIGAGTYLIVTSS